MNGKPEKIIWRVQEIGHLFSQRCHRDWPQAYYRDVTGQIGELAARLRPIGGVSYSAKVKETTDVETLVYVYKYGRRTNAFYRLPACLGLRAAKAQLAKWYAENHLKLGRF